MLLQNCRVLLDERFDKLCEQQDDFAIAITNIYHFLEQGLVLLLLQREMALRRLQLLLNRLNARVEIVHQILLLSVLSRSLRLQFELLVRILYLLLEVLDLLLVLLDNLLTEVRALGQLFLDLLVVFQVFR